MMDGGMIEALDECECAGARRLFGVVCVVACVARGITRGTASA